MDELREDQEPETFLAFPCSLSMFPRMRTRTRREVFYSRWGEGCLL